MPDSLRPLLHAALACQEEPRMPVGWVHASDVTSTELEFCPRQWYLMGRDGVRPRASSSHAAQAFSHRMGHLYQDLVTDLLGSKVLGSWECPCGTREALTRRPLDPCHSCGALAWRHVETRFVARSSGIGAGIDAMVDLGRPAGLTVVEVKGMKPADFAKLAMPRAEHRLRTALYLRIIADSGSMLRRAVDTSRAVVLYVAKGGWGTRDDAVRSWKVPHDSGWSPFKEFEVRRDDPLTEVEWQKGVDLVQAKASGQAPRRICATQMDRRALGCCCVHPCFSEP